jgi:FkbM family methyltransferase
MSARGLLRRTYNGVNKRVARQIPVSLASPRIDIGLRPVGSGDGAWMTPINLLGTGAVCYCFGVGVNATFDIGLAQMGFDVYSFDPTPRSLQYMRSLGKAADSVTFVPFGVWNDDCEMRFYAPANRRHANWSTADLHGTGEYFVAECKRIEHLAKELGHDHVDLVKIDIEGSWGPVLEDMVDSGCLPRVLQVEFDSPTSLRKQRRAIRLLRDSGLAPVHRDRENFVFVSMAALEPVTSP